MCGIAGISGGNHQDGVRIGESIAHRGPDFNGIWSDSSYTFSHRLLAIRSGEERSRQPWTTPSSPWVLLFNGQIYNTDAIKKRLPATYRDEELDTALIFALIEQERENFIEYIEGMFAIALYEKDTKTLRLYRDPSGQKPLYYTEGITPFAFASEIKAILKGAAIPRVADDTAVQIAKTLGYIPGDKTLFAHIKKVRPGEAITRTQDGNVVRTYFRSNTQIEDTKTNHEALQETVVKHLASKKKVALNLSGGMDSSLLLHEMSEAGFSMHTYTTRFVDAGSGVFNDDADLARRLAKHYGSTHKEILINRDTYRDNMLDAVRAIEEPNYNISLATYLIIANAEGILGDQNRVTLSGDGGDELFGGYDAYRTALRYQTFMRSITPLGFNIYKALREGQWWDYANPLDQWLRMKFFFFENTSTWRRAVRDYLAQQLPPSWEKRSRDPVRDMMLLDRLFWLASENFIRSDKLYMTQSLELRSPLSYEPLRRFFDRRLTEQDYFSVGVNKFTLRALYTNKLPPFIIDRTQKTGWRSPISNWWGEDYATLFREAFRNAPRGGNTDWDNVEQIINHKSTWPGKYLHLYYSLAVLSKEFDLPV